MNENRSTNQDVMQDEITIQFVKQNGTYKVGSFASTNALDMTGVLGITSTLLVLINNEVDVKAYQEAVIKKQIDNQVSTEVGKIMEKYR